MRVLSAERISAAGRRGSSRPLVVETSAGTRIVKLRGAAQGTGPLVAEIIVAELAHAVGLHVPPWSPVELRPGIETADWDDELADLLAASVGVNLGFDFLPDAREFVSSDVERVPAAMRAAILWLDRLVMNPDRTPRNPNALWWADQLWLIDHGASLGFQYHWDAVSEGSPREPGLPPVAHLFEAALSPDDILSIDETLAERLARDVLEAAVAAVPDTFLRPLAGPVASARAERTKIERRRAAYSAYLWKRLKAPRPFVQWRPLPADRQPGRPPAWLARRT